MAHSKCRSTSFLVKVAETIVICSMNMFSGFLAPVIAATLLDLQIQVGITVDKAALLISWLFVGRLPGILLASLFFDRVPRQPTLAMTSLLLAVFFAVVPVFRNYVAMSVIVAITGICFGFMVVGINRSIFQLWTSPVDRTAIQVSTFGFAVGSMSGPPLANLFICTERSSGAAKREMWTATNSTNDTRIYDISTIETDVSLDINSTISSVDIIDATVPGCRSLVKPFAIVSGCQVLMALTLFVIYLISLKLKRRKTRSKMQPSQLCHSQVQVVVAASGLNRPLDSKLHSPSNYDENLNQTIEYNENNFDDEISRLSPQKGAVSASVDAAAVTANRRHLNRQTILLASFLFVHANVEITYGALILPFCVAQFGMTEQAGNRVATVYWTAFAIGRLVIVAGTRVAGPELLLSIGVAVNLICLGVLAATSELATAAAATVAIWLCSAIIGLGVSSMFPQTIGLLAVYESELLERQQQKPLAGKSPVVTRISAAVTTTGGVSARRLSFLMFIHAVGCFVGPSAAGAAFGRLGSAWFVRYLVISAALSAVIMAVIRIHWARRRRRRHGYASQYDDDILNSNAGAILSSGGKN